MSTLQKVGLGLLVLGFILPIMGFNVPFFSLAWLPSDIPDMGRVLVSGYLVDSTNPSSPSYVPKSEVKTLSVEWDCEKDTVTACFYRQSDNGSLGNSTLSWADYGIWKGNIVTVNSGVVVRLYLKATVSPPTVAQKVVKEMTVYYVVTENSPSVIVFLNGWPVAWNGTVPVTSAYITFRVQVTNGFYVNQLYFELYLTSTETTIEEWVDTAVKTLGPFSTDTYEYTLPQSGTYSLEGHLYGSANEDFTVMSLTVTYGGGGWGGFTNLRVFLNILTIGGFLLAVVGTIRKKEKPSKTQD